MMNLLKQILAAMVMTAVVSTGAVAQGKGKGQDKRPPKDKVRVIEGKGGNKPPPQKPRDDDRRGKKRP